MIRTASDPERIPGLVSVIVPVYNRPQLLVEAVDSALNQDHRSLEVIVVDDGSTDGRTPEAAAGLVSVQPGRVRVCTVTNRGPGLAREHGRQQARGEFIQYLDSDDVLLPGKLSTQVAALRARPEADVAYGITLFRDARGHLAAGAHKDTGVERTQMFPSFLHARWWDTSTPLYRATVCETAGPWTDLRLEEDWEYDCRVAAGGGRLVYCAVPVSETRDHADARLCRGTAHDPIRLAMRARSHQLIWTHAQKAGLPDSHPEDVARFARSLFLLARQCGAAGLLPQSGILLSLAVEAGGRGKARFQIPAYRWLSRCLGAQRIANLSQRLDHWRAALQRPAAPTADLGNRSGPAT